MILKGTAVSKGIVIGEVFKYVPFKPNIEKEYISKQDTSNVLKKFSEVRDSVKIELENIIVALQEKNEESKIFNAHIEILNDVAINEEIEDMIIKELLTAEYAIKFVYLKYAKILEMSNDEIIKERASDIKDVYNRIIKKWFGVVDIDLASLDRPVVVFAHDIFPSDTATMKKENVMAIVTEIGGYTSHTAILARNYGIPAILGVTDAMKIVKDESNVIIDAIDGSVHTDPSQEVLQKFESARNVFLVKKKELEKFIYEKPYTQDGIYIDICLNIGSAKHKELELEEFTDGVGLFRSEFLYMGKSALPTENEQFESYKKVVEIYGDRPVIIRTLDIGGDKKLDYLELPNEENPFLGLRALRFCFEQMPIFKTQLRALLRASVYGNLWIMFPMVGSMDDIRFAKGIVEEVKAELAIENIPFNHNIKLGIMIEIPSIAIIADVAASEVDFASLGTNDLCQYLTAVDRLNPKVSEYYQSFHPAMFRLIDNVISSFQRQNKIISVCGEMGGDPLAASVLIGLGLRKLSVNSASVSEIKAMISKINIPKATRIAQTVLGLSTAAQVENFLKSEITQL